MDKYRFPRKAAASIVKVKDGVYISKHDPGIHRKMLHYHPNDQDLMYSYARRLSAQGDPKKAEELYERAAAQGHAASLGKLVELRRPVPAHGPAYAQHPTIVPAKAPAASKKESITAHPLWPYLLGLLLILLAALLILLVLVSRSYFFERKEYHYYYESTVKTTAAAAPAKPAATGGGLPAGSTEPSLNRPLPADRLYLSVLTSAIENYKQTSGTYPDSLDKLDGGSPDNWISFIPEGVGYNGSPSGFTLTAEGVQGPLAPSGLELLFYPDDNRLGLALAGRILALYPVASGAPGQALPYKESSVGRRVVNPNGGSGALGTRGLELGGGYALHGTNDESSIGNKVTKGCIRLLNKDIEALYPYVPVGTPFKVVAGKTEQEPLYPNGLPVLSSYDVSDEATPGVVYHWNS